MLRICELEVKLSLKCDILGFKVNIPYKLTNMPNNYTIIAPNFAL